jgi:DNA-binding MarR family transcriptional regulator
MNKETKNLEFLFDLAKTQAMLSRSFGNSLGGLNEFMILFYLNNAPENKMRRIDLANKLGFTASGITRVLLPMEKIGLVKKEKHDYDARISLVILSPAGKRELNERLERATLLADSLLGSAKEKTIAEFSSLLTNICRSIKLG